MNSYIGKIKNSGTQTVQAPYPQKKKSNTVKKSEIKKKGKESK